MEKQALYDRVAVIIHETFDIDPARITPDAQFTDLDIDSIDAVDLMVQLKQLTGKRLQPDSFKNVRSVQDVVDALHQVMQE